MSEINDMLQTIDPALLLCDDDDSDYDEDDMVGESTSTMDTSMLDDDMLTASSSLSVTTATTDDDISILVNSSSDKTNDNAIETKSKSEIDLNTMAQYFLLPIPDAAKHIGVSTTTLKAACREHGIMRWPSRKLQSMKKVMMPAQFAVYYQYVLKHPVEAVSRLLSDPQIIVAKHAAATKHLSSSSDATFSELPTKRVSKRRQDTQNNLPAPKPDRCHWSLQETKLLLDMVLKNHNDLPEPNEIYARLHAELSQCKKTLRHIVTKRSNLVQKAVLQKVRVVDLLRLYIAKLQGDTTPEMLKVPIVSQRQLYVQLLALTQSHNEIRAHLGLPPFNITTTI